MIVYDKKWENRVILSHHDHLALDIWHQCWPEMLKVDSSLTYQLWAPWVNISTEYPALHAHNSMNNCLIYMTASQYALSSIQFLTGTIVTHWQVYDSILVGCLLNCTRILRTYFVIAWHLWFFLILSLCTVPFGTIFKRTVLLIPLYAVLCNGNMPLQGYRKAYILGKFHSHQLYLLQLIQQKKDSLVVVPYFHWLEQLSMSEINKEIVWLMSPAAKL